MWTLQFQEEGPFLSYCWEGLGVLSCLLLLLALKQCSCEQREKLASTHCCVKEGSLQSLHTV